MMSSGATVWLTLGGLALSCCTAQVLEPRSRFIEDGVMLESSSTWAGEPIVVDSAGVTLTGGLSLAAGDDDRVRATARMLAIADTSAKPDADAAIDEAKRSTYAITSEGGATLVRCGAVGQFGSVAPGDAGCDALAVTLPRGTAEQPLTLTARSGKGLLAGSFKEATLASLELHGSNGAMEITAAATPNATILLVAETGDSVLLRLPADFAADAITLEAPPEAIDTTAFPDLQRGAGRGEAGRGARSITVRAGRIVLARQE